ncbi:retinoblastoma binding protein 9 [Pelomyxa schiedti]|nr:retinoblastoma binding protein 9 [Pelomyxa schiedti]
MASRIIVVPGNCVGWVEGAHWYRYVREVMAPHNVEVVLRDFPDPVYARESVWIPFLRDELHCDADTVVVGHSSGAAAAMRLAESGVRLRGLALVSAYHTDGGDETEAASGYFSRPFDWPRIIDNSGFIVQFHGADDPLAPVEEGRTISNHLNSEPQICTKVLQVTPGRLESYSGTTSLVSHYRTTYEITLLPLSHHILNRSGQGIVRNKRRRTLPSPVQHMLVWLPQLVNVNLDPIKGPILLWVYDVPEDISGSQREQSLPEALLLKGKEPPDCEPSSLLALSAGYDNILTADSCAYDTHSGSLFTNEHVLQCVTCICGESCALVAMVGGAAVTK